MLKASWGGGGRGMRVIESDAQLAELLPVARREAMAAFGNDEVYLEKLVRRARHLEVQILGDTHGNLVHLYRTRLHGAAAQPEGGRARAGGVPQRCRARARCARRRSRSAAPHTTAMPARSSSCRTPTAASSTSSRSIRASRSSTR